ncbi:MAG: TraR/DksA family transcriptional regulator [Anaeromyxobacteraceae bacterium]
MTPKQRTALREALERTKAQVTTSAPARIEPNRTDPAAAGVADEDAQALSEMLQVLASERNRGQAALLSRIEKALRKLSAAPEDYGLCEDCEEEIPLARMKAMPWATLCAPCQARAEPRRGAGRKSLTDFK